MLDTIISSLSKLTYISYVSPTAHWEGTAMCYRWENGGTERLHNLPKVTQLAAGRAEFLGQVLWLWTTLTGYWLELYQLTVVMMLVALCRPELVICYVLHEWKKNGIKGWLINALSLIGKIFQYMDSMEVWRSVWSQDP